MGLGIDVDVVDGMALKTTTPMKATKLTMAKMTPREVVVTTLTVLAETSMMVVTEMMPTRERWI